MSRGLLTRSALLPVLRYFSGSVRSATRLPHVTVRRSATRLPPRCHPSNSDIARRSRLHSHLQGSDLSCGQVQDRSERFQKPRNHQMSAGAAPRNIGKWHLRAILDTIRLSDTSVVNSLHFRELEAILEGPQPKFVWTIAVEENLKTLTRSNWHATAAGTPVPS